MSTAAILHWWIVWLIVGGIVVVAAAALLLTIIALAHSIAKLAATALEVVGDIEVYTRPIWQLTVTNRVAADMEVGAGAMAHNAETIATALGSGGQ